MKDFRDRKIVAGFAEEAARLVEQVGVLGGVRDAKADPCMEALLLGEVRGDVDHQHARDIQDMFARRLRDDGLQQVVGVVEELAVLAVDVRVAAAVAVAPDELYG